MIPNGFKLISASPFRLQDDSGTTIIYEQGLGPVQRVLDQSAKAIEDALRGGVKRVHVVSYKSPEGILGEVFTNEGTGTLIVEDIKALSPAEQSA